MSALAWWFERRVDSCLHRGSLLEFGCGQRFPLTKLLGDKFERCAATDLENVPVCTHPPAVDFRQCSESTIPFADQQFDVIAMRSVLEHVRDPAVVFAELDRVLRPGGRVFLNLPNLWDYVSVIAKLAGSRKSRLFKRLTAPSKVDFPVFYRCNTRRALRRALGSTDLSIPSFRPMPSEPAYLKFFVPFYLLGAVYQFVISVMGLDVLQPSFVVVLEKIAAPESRS